MRNPMTMHSAGKSDRARNASRNGRQQRKTWPARGTPTQIKAISVGRTHCNVSPGRDLSEDQPAMTEIRPGNAHREDIEIEGVS